MTWLQRLRDERNELEGRLLKLTDMLELPSPHISPGQLRLLAIQEAAMTTYLTVLEARLMHALEEQ